MWKFITTNSEESFDCMELLISRALDGTLPDTDERRILKIGNSKEIKLFLKLFLTSGTGAQGDSSGTGEQTESSRRAAEQGDADSMYELGESYNYGLGVEENEEQAVEWYRKAAELGQTDAMHMLAECYSSGTGVRQDAREAAQWVRRAKEQDDTGIE